MSYVPLTQAVTSGDAGAVKALLANGADVNERTGGGQTPLILATIFGHTHLIPLLLDAGADPQLRDNLGLNAIDWAQRRGATEVIDVLSNKPVGASGTTTRTQAPPPRSLEPNVEKSTTVSEEERSRRWIAGLKQRIAEQSQRIAEQSQRIPEQSQREVPDGPNIFRPHVPFPLESLPLFSSSGREPQPEIPAEPSVPQPELPVTPEPQPEIPAPSPDPQHELPAEPQQPEPESPAEPTQPEVEAVTPRPDATPRGDTAPRLDAALRPDAAPRPDPTARGEAALRPDATPRGDAVPGVDAKPRGDAVPGVDAKPRGDAAPRPDATARGEAALRPDATPRRDAAPPLDAAPQVEHVAPQPATTQADDVAPQTEASAGAVEPTPAPPRRSARKRCPKCNAIYNSELVAYCAHHIVALVDDDETPAPIISQPQATSPVLFWMIIIITLTGSLMVGSVVAAFFYSSKQVQPAAATPKSPQTPPSIQKGTPAAGRELESKVVSLPIAECPLNGQEAIPGTVVVRVTVSKTGQVTQANASGGDWLLRSAATEAARKSTFAPEKLRGRTTQGTITYTFEP